MSEPKLWPGQPVAGRGCCTGNGNGNGRARLCLGRRLSSSFGPRFQVLFSRCSKKRQWPGYEVLRSAFFVSTLMEKYKKIIVSFMGTPSLTIILDTSHGLFNIEYFRSVHSLSTHNVCDSSSHTWRSAASPGFAHEIDALVSPERHTRRPYSHPSMRAGHSTSKNCMTSRCIASFFC